VWLYLIALAAPSAFAASGDEFYDRLFTRGLSQFSEGNYVGAYASMKIAAFGYLEDIPRFQTAEIYMTVAANKLRREADARAAAVRVVAAERVEKRYASLTLPAELRKEFEDAARKLLTADVFATLRGGGTVRPPQPAPANPAPVIVIPPQPPPASKPVPTPAPRVIPPAPQSQPPTQPRTVQPQPVPVPKAPAQVQTQPRPVPTVPAQVQTQPRPVPTVPAQVQTQPRPVPTAPAQVQTQPRPVPTAPAQVQTQPRPVPSPPAQVQTQPRPVQPQPQPQPARPATESGVLADADRAVNSGDLAAARSLYRSILDAPQISHPTALRVAEGLYRSRDFAGAIRAFERAGAIGTGEEQFHYYYAVALYESGRYAGAKRELRAALPFIEVTPDVERYRVKIEGAIE
jgi:tetratricopeptide (TPR) repeat protein